ncbi:hypothetical protein HY768_04880 [candidate division TA06 bacterium]|uniref:Uncharacterized protein n=1 Tax=candidate division TA06 bacterium TaxID=2250710 RepID=A0A933I8E7_UNCT6|nr:hypothetical protein [candidate division TA06 bacterium]
MKRTLAICLLIGLTLCLGCATISVRYQMTAPQPQTVTVQGLDPKDKIIEVFDNYQSTVATGTWMWMVLKRGNAYNLCKIDLVGGRVSDIQPLTTYNPAQPFYWTKFAETKMGGGAACVGACMSATPCGGTTNKWGFEIEKQFWGSTNHSVSISYQYSEKSSSDFGQSYRASEWQAGFRESFAKGDTIVDIGKYNGYSNTYLLKTHPKARYYPLFANVYIGFQPNSMKDVAIVDMFIYDIVQKEAWGADLDFGKGSFYVDGAVTPDYSTACLIIGQPGNYTIRQYKPNELMRAIKMFKTIQ